MENISWLLTSIIFLVDLAVRTGLALRVIMRKQAASVSLSWLTIILFLPLAGAVIYLLFGENRVGQKRALRAGTELQRIRQWAENLKQRAHVDWENRNPECRPIHLQADRVIGLPTLPGNDLEIIEDSKIFFANLIGDINAAQTSCLLEFYIWQDGGMADAVAEALVRASQRGVDCRILLDSVGSKQFLRSSTAKKLRKEPNIRIVEALPAGIFRALFVRLDLRNHRKIVVIDGKTGYTGSQNLVDPLFFKQNQGVGQWKDTMVRVRGPVVELMAASFLYDWMLEVDVSLDELLSDIDLKPCEEVGQVPVQLVPSGPGLVKDAIHNLLLTTMYAARKEIILTTPYFVPDNAILAALRSAAQRGVNVTIIVPERNDSKLVHFASQARFEELLDAGVRLLLFTQGLLHSKTITVDSDFSLFGSVNLDMRSFWLNFELTFFVYDGKFTNNLRAIQQKYIQEAYELQQEDLAERGFVQRFRENTALLVGPLL